MGPAENVEPEENETLLLAATLVDANDMLCDILYGDGNELDWNDLDELDDIFAQIVSPSLNIEPLIMAPVEELEPEVNLTIPLAAT